MADWLVLDEALKAEWEAVASARASELVGRTLHVTVHLPSPAEAKAAYEGNRNLLGGICWADDDGNEHGVQEIVPFHGSC